jgi:hypothetical protein
MRYEDYQPEIDEIISTLRKIEGRLNNTRPFLENFSSLCSQFPGKRIPLKESPDIHSFLTHPIGLPDIRKEAKKSGKTRVYLDIDQYLECKDEVLAEYLELALQTRGDALHGKPPDEILTDVTVPADGLTIVKIVGERILLQLRERDLLAAQAELLRRMDEIVNELYQVEPSE